MSDTEPVSRVPRKWCVNFEISHVLQHGLAEGLWLMQYQYAHHGYDYQGHPNNIGMTTRNWNTIRGVETPGVQPGDKLIAWCRKSTFYAVGEVTLPQSRQRHTNRARHVDLVERTVTQKGHLYFDGVVNYSDAPVLYEDFTDEWTCPASQEPGRQPQVFQYAQRIDVREWQHMVQDGVRVQGLSRAARFLRGVIFEISEGFFEEVVSRLQEAAVESEAG